MLKIGKIVKKVKRLLISSLEKPKKTYNDYYAALKECSTQNGYENNELCSMIAEKTQNHVEKLKIKPYTLNGTNVFLVLAIYHFLLKHSVKSINIIDFGGACGAHYFETRRFFPTEIVFKWCVVETKEMVKSAKQHNIGNEELFFINDLSNICFPVDFIHSSGTLQSVSSYEQYLTELIRLNAKYMLFNRMTFNENDHDIVTIQESKMSANGPGPMPEKYTDKSIFYPHTTIAFKKFSEILNDKYINEWVFEELSGVLKFNNEKIIGRGLLYTHI